MPKQPERKSPPLPQIADKKSPTEIGDASGISISGIIVNDDYNNKLTGRQGVKIFQQMKDGDATVNSGILAVTLPILSADWWVEPASESKKDEKIAEWVQKELFECGTRTWQETLSEILDYLWFGRMPFEIVWEFRYSEEFGRDMIGLRKISRRDPGSIFAWKLTNGEAGVVQQTVNGKFEIPMEKMLIFVNQKRGDNWEGRSLLRTAYKHWYIKDKLYLIDAISAERQGLGVPKGKLPTGAQPEEKDKLEEALRNLRANEKGYVMLEGDLDIEFMDMKASTTKQLMPTINHHDRAILLNILAQFLSLGSTSMGSFALSSDQSRLFILCLESIANYITGNIDRYLITKLVDYNFNVEKYPSLKFGKIGNVDHNILTTSLQRAVQTGMLTPQPEDEVYLRSVMNLPEKNEAIAVDPAMFDDILNDLNVDMDALDGNNAQDATGGAPVEDPNNPGFDMEGNPMPDATQAASDYMKLNSTDFEARYGSEVHEILKGGPAGQPLSEETKRKISEALKKHHGQKSSGGKGKGKKKTDPAIAAHQKEIASVRKQVSAITQEYRKKVLEMKAKGEKLSPQDSAKMQLELFNKTSGLKSKIADLQEKIAERKAKTAPPVADKKASEIGQTIDRINGILDKYEK